MHKITEAVTLSPELQGQFTDIRVISKGQVAAQGVGGKLMRHRAGKLVLPLREDLESPRRCCSVWSRPESSAAYTLLRC